MQRLAPWELARLSPARPAGHLLNPLGVFPPKPRAANFDLSRDATRPKGVSQEFGPDRK